MSDGSFAGTVVDPVCGMAVYEDSALTAQRDGKTFHFCGEACRNHFLSGMAADRPEGGSGGCCG